MANYLYNGVEAPALPQLTATEQETYPIAMINKNGRLIYCSAVYDADADGRVTVSLFSTIVYDVVDGQWVKQSTYPMTFKPVWTNTDILNEDGTIYLAASEPIPVGGEPIDPTSFMQGYIVGRRLAGMRGKNPEL